MQSLRLKDKVAIVTGGGTGIGRGICRALASEGADIVVADINEQTARQTCNDLSSFGGRYLPVRVDVTVESEVEHMVEETVRNFARVDILCANAGVSTMNLVVDLTEREWDYNMDVNAKGVFLCCQMVGRQMAEAGRGSIINISSIYGIASPDQRVYEYLRKERARFFKPVAYSTSKSALLNLTRYLATYWADKNVRVNTLTLGGVFNNQDEGFLKNYCARVPLGRMASEDEYNGAIIFLISDASSYMTGANLIIDGGWTAW